MSQLSTSPSSVTSASSTTSTEELETSTALGVTENESTTGASVSLAVVIPAKSAIAMKNSIAMVLRIASGRGLRAVSGAGGGLQTLAKVLWLRLSSLALSLSRLCTREARGGA